MTTSPYVITAISHSAAFPEGFQEGFLQFLNQGHEQLTLDSHNTLSTRAIDYFVGAPSLDEVKATVDKYTNQQEVDLVFQKNDEFRRNKKLVVFDMDSTLIYQEVIELIAAYAGVEDKVAEITNRAMNNELDFVQSLQARVALLKGIKTKTLYDEIKDKLLVTEGVPELTKGLGRTGCKLAVLSGGFTPFANYMKETLHLDYARANFLATEIDPTTGEEVLSGHTIGDIVDGQCKAKTLLQLAKEYDVPVESTVMVGDGGNDLPAMGVAGFGIAWNAKPKVQEAAPCKLNTKSLRDAFYVFGYTDDEIVQLLK